MRIEKEISIYDFVCAISEAVDFISPLMNNHHKMVSYMSYRFAQEANLPENDVQDVILASILHDIGAFSIEDRTVFSTYDSHEAIWNQHDLMGYKLLKRFEPLSKAATLIKYHHAHFDKLKPNIPIGSHIIHLADSISTLFSDNCEILKQAPDIQAKISQRKDEFHPDLLTIFFELARKEYFWLEAFHPSFGEIMLKKMCFSKLIVDMETLRSFAKLTAQIIDFRSRFTATHSSGVAAVANSLTSISGYPE
jgi:response regulator RpfG family c-di-GMP phosphodiesterase